MGKTITFGHFEMTVRDGDIEKIVWVYLLVPLKVFILRLWTQTVQEELTQGEGTK